MRSKNRIPAEFSQCLLVFNQRLLRPFGVSEGVTKTHMRDRVLWIFLGNFLIFLYRVVVSVQNLQCPSKTFTHGEIAWVPLDNFVQVDYCLFVFTLCLCMLPHRAQGIREAGPHGCVFRVFVKLLTKLVDRKSKLFHSLVGFADREQHITE